MLVSFLAVALRTIPEYVSFFTKPPREAEKT